VLGLEPVHGRYHPLLLLAPTRSPRIVAADTARRPRRAIRQACGHKRRVPPSGRGRDGIPRRPIRVGLAPAHVVAAGERRLGRAAPRAQGVHALRLNVSPAQRQQLARRRAVSTLGLEAIGGHIHQPSPRAEGEALRARRLVHRDCPCFELRALAARQSRLVQHRDQPLELLRGVGNPGTRRIPRRLRQVVVDRAETGGRAQQLDQLPVVTPQVHREPRPTLAQRETALGAHEAAYVAQGLRAAVGERAGHQRATAIPAGRMKAVLERA
jgi:hypothetical protein